MAKRGKTVAISIAAAGVVVLVDMAFAAKGWIYERYCLWQLEADTDFERGWRFAEGMVRPEMAFRRYCGRRSPLSDSDSL